MSETCEHREAKFGCPGCVARVRAQYPEFPLQASRNVPPGPVSVPWPVADKAWAAYSAQYGRDQSVESLAQRGGFGWDEMDDLFPGWREATDEWVRLRADLAAEREARQTAEAEERACRKELAAEFARAEQAERERNTLREAFMGAAPDTYDAVASALVECLDDGPRMVMAKHARRMETRAREAERDREEARELAADRGQEALEAIAAFDAEKAARERAEAARDEAMAELSKANRETMAAVNRWERAEAERDNYRQQAMDRGAETASACQERDLWHERAERAESDNAALLRSIAEWAAKLDAFPALHGSAVDLVRTEMRAAFGQTDHPGDSMLERLRALEEVSEACAAYFIANAAEHDDGCPEDDTCECSLVVRVNAAFLKADALKGGGA